MTVSRQIILKAPFKCPPHAIFSIDQLLFLQGKIVLKQKQWQQVGKWYGCIVPISDHFILCPPFLISDEQNVPLAIPLNSSLRTSTWQGRLGEGLKCYKRMETLGSTRARSRDAGVTLCTWLIVQFDSAFGFSKAASGEVKRFLAT